MFGTVVFRQEEGVTLVELMVALAIIGLIIAGVYSFYWYGHGMFDAGTDKAQLQQKVRQIAEEISREVRMVDRLELQQQKHEGKEYPSHIYFEENEQKILMSNEGETRVLAQEVKDLRFTVNESKELLEFVILVKDGRGNERTYRNTVNLLNRPNITDDLAEEDDNPTFKSINFAHP